MKKALNQRIAIVGAGPAGLTAAETLKNKGYTNITVLEKNSSAGGKCSSIGHEGRSYELGAGIIVENNHTVRRLAKKFGVKIDNVDFSRKITFLDIKTGKSLPETTFIEKMVLFSQIFLIYKKLLNKYKRINDPGFVKVDKDLCKPFSEWARENKLGLAAKGLSYFFTGFGYNYFEEVPAAYVLKYYSWATLKSFMKKSLYTFTDGIQALWLAVAKNHRVIYDTVIEKIERDQVVKIKTTKEQLEFDTLILACPLDESLKYLEVIDQEKDLFSKIIYCDYRTYALFIKGFPKQDGYLPGNFKASRKGHPVLWYNRYVDSDLYTFYVLGDFQISDEEVLKNIEKVVEQLGGKIEKVHTKARWKYFPHVNSEELRNGYFDKLESLQGKNNSYYVGELLSFSTVDLSSSYAEKLIERYF